MNDAARDSIGLVLGRLCEIFYGMDHAILCQPSGEIRNKLTEANILLMQAQDILKDLAAVTQRIE